MCTMWVNSLCVERVGNGDYGAALEGVGFREFYFVDKPRPGAGGDADDPLDGEPRRLHLRRLA